VAVRFVNVAAPGVVPPMVPGAANVAPPSAEALRFDTTVVEVTVSGAVPVETVEISRVPVTVLEPVTAPDAATVVNAPVDAVVAPTGVLSTEPPSIF
jgi:hypothetical protein